MKFLIVSTFLIASSFSQSDAIQLQDISEEMLAPDHISMLIHEDLINEFFKNMGKVSGGGKNYEWILKNPRIEITNKKAVFKAEIQVLVGFISSTQDVIGKVDVRYNAKDNLIIVEVVDADVIIDIAGYDIGKIDIGKHFSKPLKLSGPQSVSENIEFSLPSGKVRKIDISVKSHTLDLIDGAIKVSTSLGFKVLDN